MKEPSFGKALPQSQWIQRSHRVDPNSHIPFEKETPKMSKRGWLLYGIVVLACFAIGFFS